MALTQFEMDAVTSVVVSLQRIADALETIKDRMPQEPEPSLYEADACDFPCDRRSAPNPEPVPCYILDKHGKPQSCICEDGNYDKCPRDIALHKELEGGKHA